MVTAADLDAQINILFVSKEGVEESSDFIITYKVTADSFDACRVASKDLREKCDAPRSNQRWDNRNWTFNRGTGKWETTYSVYVDGIEYAIERSNDYQAFLRTDPREEEMERYCEFMSGG